MRKTNCWILIVLLLSFPMFSMGNDDKAEKIIDRLIENYEKQREGIKDMITTKEDAVVYQKWEKKNGETIYKWRQEKDVNGQKQIAVFDGKNYYVKNPQTGEVEEKEEGNMNPLHFYKDLKEVDCKYAGRKKVNGRNCHVIKAEDVPMDKLFQGSKSPGMGGEEQASSTENVMIDIQLFIDDSDWVMPKMIYDMENTGEEPSGPQQGGFNEARSVVVNKDFREVEGMMIAFETVNTMKIKMSAEQKEQAKQMRESFKKMEEEMEDMPPEQREMMEQRMEERMGNSKQLLGGNEMKTVTKIENVEVNTGISDDLFDGSNL